jgi:hypothetical protein
MGPALLTSCDETSKTGTDTTGKQTAFSKLKFPLYLRGKLVDKTTQQPVANAAVRILQQDQTLLTGTTDKHGDFKIRIGQNDLSGSHFDLILHRSGYVNDTVHAVNVADDLSHLRLTITARNETQELCKPGEVTIIETTVGDIAPPDETIRGEIALPEPPTAGVPAME